MSSKDMIDLRRVLFLEGLRKGLSAEELHEFIESGISQVQLARSSGKLLKRMKAAG